jgi:hypothetical protein
MEILLYQSPLRTLVLLKVEDFHNTSFFRITAINLHIIIISISLNYKQR